MTNATSSRQIGDLTFEEAGTRLRATSILCLPMGSFEQHGPHLPLNTDLVIADGLTARIVARWGDAFDLWQLPGLPVGLSREHSWASGTLSLTVQGMTALLRDLGRDIVRAFPTRNLVIVNGHGGNKGILEALVREFRGDFGLNLCAVHLGPLISPVTDARVPEIHGGRDETSVMLALAPGLVRLDAVRRLNHPPDGAAVRAMILDPSTSWPWSSDDPRLSDGGVIGDAGASSAEHGRAIIERVVASAENVFKRLLENQAAR